MDTDKNGIIDFKEFVDCLQNWLTEESRDESTVRKTQTSNANKAREQIHKRISSFFTQFKRASNFDEIRAKMAADAKATEGKGTRCAANALAPAPAPALLLHRTMTAEDDLSSADTS